MVLLLVGYMICVCGVQASEVVSVNGTMSLFTEGVAANEYRSCMMNLVVFTQEQFQLMLQK
jgi:hypothetical protein